MQVKNMQQQPTIKMMLVADKKRTIQTLAKLISHYLEMNVKGRSITKPAAFKLMLDEIVTKYRFLELQEIEYIFRNGILGKYGIIYNDISIDTICGEGGWVQRYLTEERIKKPKPVQDVKKLETGKVITIDEFYKRHPELAEKRRQKEIMYKLITGDVSLEMLTDYGIDKEKFESEHKEIWERDYKEHITFEQFLKFGIRNIIEKNI